MDLHVGGRTLTGVVASLASAALAVGAVAQEASRVLTAHGDARIVGDRLAVRLDATCDPMEAERLLRSILPEGAVAGVVPALRVGPADAGLAARLGLDRDYVVVLTAPFDGADVFDALAAPGGGVEWAERLPTGFPTDSTSETLAPNDPLFANQYGLHNVGQSILGTLGSPGADINAIGAWGLRGTAKIPIVAVLDSGIAPHPDLAGVLLPGWNVPLQNTDTGDNYSSHGTHVAGIIAAIHNNGAGIAGVAPECRLLPVKVTNLFGQTDAAWLSEGIIWAADHGADVLNISIGLSSGTTQLRSAVQYAAAKGCVIVCSAGNTPTLPVVFPARYPETISVSATDNRDAILSISASGAEIDMAAPGWNVLSTWHLWSSPNTYEFRSGTSQAAPMVAGVAALIRATRPDLPGTTVRLILNASCRDLGSRGWDPVYGHGRIDAALAVANAKAFGGSSGGTATPGGECPADMNRDGVLSSADYFLFLNLFAARDPRADFALPHGVFNSDDFFSFSSVYIAGCGG